MTDHEVEPLLTTVDLMKSFSVRRSIAGRFSRKPARRAVAVDGVSLSVVRGEVLGIVGESGSGKTTLARCLLQLVRPDAGSVRFEGTELTTLRRKQLAPIRRRIQMIFQDPYSSLNPRMRIGRAIAEPAVFHGVVSRANAAEHVEQVLALVGLPGSNARRYPAQLSGGQRQRVAIGRALSLQPDVLIADEPVSALDVSIQAQILNLLGDLVQTLGLTMVFVAHQLSVVRYVSDRVAIMYLGRIVEIGPTEEIFQHPQHPYTAGLLEAAPRPDPGQRRDQPALYGDIPSPLSIPSGCRFRTRCRFAQEDCVLIDPALAEVGPGHRVACPVLPFAAPR